MQIDLNFKFVNDAQRLFFENQKRNLCFNGGYGNGKTFGGCMKALALLVRFPGYRMVIGRLRSNELHSTTMVTFYKVCTPELYDSNYGGNRVDSRGYVKLINGSEVLFKHFDEETETSIRSLEVNSVLLDQAEEISENIYLHLDSRVGRWDKAVVPPDLLENYPEWPRNEFTGLPMAPSYMLLLCNPAEEGEMHYIWQRYHPDSLEHQLNYSKTHYYIEATSRDNPALNKETLGVMESRDAVWKERFIEGKWGRGGGNIHNILPSSIIDPSRDFLIRLRKQANLYRILDHGGTTPTCCLWGASWNNLYYVWQEYYAADRLISDHRKAISELRFFTDEKERVCQDEYSEDVADPDIFVKRSQKNGGFWCVADEYLDDKLDSLKDSPTITWSPADNNELATRNRINELLKLHPSVKHPITGESPAPKLYFCKRSENNPTGCYHAVRETKAQKYKLLGTINGRPMYSDDRNDSIVDHAYDTVRYFCAIHAGFPKEQRRKPPANSFENLRKRIKALRIAGYYDKYSHV